MKSDEFAREEGFLADARMREEDEKGKKIRKKCARYLSRERTTRLGALHEGRVKKVRRFIRRATIEIGPAYDRPKKSATRGR